MKYLVLIWLGMMLVIFQVNCQSYDKYIVHKSVSQNGVLVYSENLDFYKSDSQLHNSYSITKTITAIAIGCLIQDRFLKDENQKLTTLLPQFFGKHRSHPYTKELTVKHLLTMSTGYRWSLYSHLADLKYRVNHLKEVYAKPPYYAPGSVFIYDDANVHLLSVLVHKLTGERLGNYVKRRIFTPLGIINYQWGTDAVGNHTGGYGLKISANDLHKIAQLLYQEGQWNGKQIFDQPYLVRMMSKQHSGGWPGNTYYGYLIWQNDYKGVHYAYGLGYDGNYMVIFPKQKMSAVIYCKSGLGLNYINLPRNWIDDFVIKNYVK